MTAIASPLSLILERALAGDQIEHALFCTFTFDAGYFERVALGPLDGTGAQITVVADATMANLDPYAARKVGSRYSLGLVHHSAAFHPKLAVLIGHGNFTVAIGSGNVTMSGWHANEELWTCIESDAESWSPAVAAVGRWLEDLTVSAHVGQHVAGHIASIGGKLVRPSTGPTIDLPAVLGNLQQPIIEQLPTGPVEELNLYAPFHGHGADAIRSLCERLQPELLRVGYQPGSTALDPESVKKYLEFLAVPFELRALDPSRYRHGKLVEWRSGGTWRTITGSPNLSRAALLKTPSQGGNFELAVLTEQAQPLFPGGWELTEHGSFEALSPQSFESSPQGSSIQILEAVLDGEVLVLTLNRPAAEDVKVQVAPAGQPPELWSAWGVVRAGSESAELEPLRGGSWVQVVGTDGFPSRAIPVLGPAAFSRRTAVTGSSGPPMPDIAELFTDDDAASRFLHHVGALKEKLAAARPPAIAGGGGGGSEAGATASTWEEYLDGMAGYLGRDVLNFSLGLSTNTLTSVSVPDWDDEDIDDAEAGLEGDTAEAMEAVAEPAGQSLTKAQLTDAGRAKIMKQLERFARPDATTDPIIRLLSVRATLAFFADGDWPFNDTPRIDVLLDHVAGILDNQSDQSQVRRRQAAMAALCLSLVRGCVAPIPPSLQSLRIDRLSVRLKSVVNDLDQDDLDAYCQDLSESLGENAHPNGVLAFALDILADDPVAEAVRKLAESDRGILAHVSGRVLVLPAAERAAARHLAYTCLVVLDGAGDVAVQVGAGESAETWVWRSPHLVRVFVNPKGPVANIWQFKPGSSPGSAGSPDGYPSSKDVAGSSVDWMIVDEALAAVGLSRRRHFLD